MSEAQFINSYDSELQMNLMPYDYIPPVDIKTEPYIPETAHGPYIQIIEEPKQRGFRFRYECEGPSHGGLPGASSEKNRRTYPTVKINNYVGPARLEVQLVSHCDPPQVHAHSLVGRNCCTESGTCSVDIGPNDLTAAFSNLGILHVTKKGVEDVLNRRLREERKRQKGPHYHLTESEDVSLVKEAKDLGKKMDLNIVRLKFTAFLQDSNGGFTRGLKPVVSNPIYDSKSPNASNLKISRMDKTCGSVLGGDEIFLLCDKVQKDDIEIRFYEEDDEGGWEYAIVFKTPAYHSAEIERPVTVFLQLKRKKAGDSSDPKQFTYIPQVQDKEETEGQTGGQTGSPLQQQLFQLTAALRSRASLSARQTAAALLQYCSSGDARVLLAIQRHLCGVQDGNGDTPLHLAIIHQQTSVIQQLIHTLLSSQQQNVLNTANHLQQVKVLEALLRAGADPSRLDGEGRSPLHLAALNGDAASLRPLLAHLGEHNAHLVNAYDYHGMQPLHLAVRRDGERCLRLLVGGGAKINAPELKSGHTALHLSLKADVNAVTFGGNSALHLAASLGSPTLVSMLIAAGADKNIENDEPLFFSSSSDEEDEEPIREREAASEPIREQEVASQPIRDRERPAPGHTPLDLARCQKVRSLLVSDQRSSKSSKKMKSSSVSDAGVPAGDLDEETLSHLVELLSVGGGTGETGGGDAPWRKLAERLGMMTLTPLYLESPSPCQQLLRHYQLGGGALSALVEALQSLGLTEGVRLLRDKQLQEEKHNTDATVDSGFGSQPMDEEEEPPVANQ
ncbi:hypothetical protein JOQ06_028159 [Pogonophryne albipinna]|uniref:RHD domain-containing protein n=1 Tax=Pogonophryne albipinna TaxID=1090488 RepID=A0AAD6AFK4_9TELE|nr:hypothetical protein JOQ06_028159 [Pogonophryne albipinna]